jgi:transcriptional regulator with XRE-family HTH domain
MEHVKHIHELEARAAALGLSRRQLCMKAGIPANSLCRWRNGQSVPSIARFRDVVSKINHVLADVATDKALSAEQGRVA